MTIDETYNIYFHYVEKRWGQARYASSMTDLLDVLCPDSLVHEMARGHNDLVNELGISSNSQTYRALGYTYNRANEYSTDKLMPMWNELYQIMDNITLGKQAGKGLGNLLDFGSIGAKLGGMIGEIVGFKAGESRGDFLSYNLEKGTNSLVAVAKYDFLHHVKPAILAEFV